MYQRGCEEMSGNVTKVRPKQEQALLALLSNRNVEKRRPRRQNRTQDVVSMAERTGVRQRLSEAAPGGIRASHSAPAPSVRRSSFRCAEDHGRFQRAGVHAAPRRGYRVGAHYQSHRDRRYRSACGSAGSSSGEWTAAALKTVIRRIARLENQFGTADGRRRLPLVACKAGWGLALDQDTCSDILDECGFLPTGPIGLVNFCDIPEGLNAAELERFLREKGAETRGFRGVANHSGAAGA